MTSRGFGEPLSANSRWQDWQESGPGLAWSDCDGDGERGGYLFFFLELMALTDASAVNAPGCDPAQLMTLQACRCCLPSPSRYRIRFQSAITRHCECTAVSVTSGALLPEIRLLQFRSPSYPGGSLGRDLCEASQRHCTEDSQAWRSGMEPIAAGALRLCPQDDWYAVCVSGHVIPDVCRIYCTEYYTMWCLGTKSLVKRTAVDAANNICIWAGQPASSPAAKRLPAL